MAVSDRPSPDGWAGWCAALAAAGVPALLVRDRALADLERFRRAAAARAELEPPARLLVSARVDLALAAGADGVHVPADGAPLAAIRTLVELARGRGAGLSLELVGRSTHSRDDVARARDEGAAYVLLGPVFATPSKPGPAAPLGLAALEEASRLGVPVLAIGGVDSPGRLRQVLDSGAHGAAGIRGFRDPRVAAELVAVVGAPSTAAAVPAATGH
jgi:thiamine-phosphate pyrophosphorylase